ncbi:leukocyte immunoglobulin-like receptor subfamily B member 4 [Myotis lucifugus]|uniref:leukocyte immunoglobulin-like receptor subfamily B member 4 n=1 Tax=Myotis lucifugus TaxID=59463 RepID=UPI000CCC7D76|nr:leukocyte immunoglobulin-like receptor subfamily B member 4 [Myotis lucifugus]
MSVLPTLLYLGLYLAQSTQAQNGYLLPPVIRAQPGPMVLYNEPVTILCQEPSHAEAYEIYKVEEPEPRAGRKLPLAGKTRTLYIQEMKPDKTGLYRCSYKSRGHWSSLSDILHLVMTGSYDKPSLSSMSSTVVASGDNVKLQCFSRIRFHAFILTQEDAPQFTQRQSSTAQDNGVQTTFHMDHVTSTQAGTYRCYGAFSKDPYVWSHPSDPLQLVVTGSLPPPVITAQPGSMVLCNEPVTILCQGPPEAEVYEIYKVEEPEPRDRRKLLMAGRTNTLYIQEMKREKTGLYRCSYKSGERWSQSNNILHLVMTGSYDKPSLSSMSGPVVAPGDNVTLQCFSRIKFDAFILTKDDAPQFTQRQSSTTQDNGQQTTFQMDHVTSTQAGTYRCYGAFSKDPYVWSHPSDPLQLVDREAPFDPIPMEPKHPQATDHNQTQNHHGILIGFPVAIVLLLLLFLLLFFILRHRHRKARNNATETKRQPEAVEPMDGPASEARDPQDVTYFQVAFNAPTHGTASAPSLLPKPAQASEYATLVLR